MRHAWRKAALGIIALLAIGATTPPGGWNATITTSPEGAPVLGNPKAAVRLTEYVSYTCPHCSHYAIESEAPLRLGYVATGKLAIEVRPVLRNSIDVAAALLANCGPKSGFFQTHSAILRRQASWITPLVNPSKAQEQRWSTGEFAARNRAIAADFHFYELMATRGFDRAAVDRCLADKPLAERLAQLSKAGAEAGVEKTPTFAINGALLLGTSDWAMLRPQLEARF